MTEAPTIDAVNANPPTLQRGRIPKRVVDGDEPDAGVTIRASESSNRRQDYRTEKLMDTAYIAITVLAAVAMASAATLSLVRHRLVVAAADVVELPRSWVPRLGALLGAGAVGLIVGFALPVLGVVTAVALVLYFLAAVGAHIRVRDHDPGRLANVLTFLVLAVAALVSSVLYHVPW